MPRRPQCAGPQFDKRPPRTYEIGMSSNGAPFSRLDRTCLQVAVLRAFGGRGLRVQS